MPTSAMNITKGEILEKFDEYINGSNNSHTPAKRITLAKELKERLNSGGDLVAAIVDSGIPLTQDQREHLNRDWLNKTQPDGAKRGWWPHLQPLDPALRQGFIRSAEAVEGTGYPVDHYWISMGQNVEMWVCKGATQITTLIATPPPPGGLGVMATEQDPIWVIRSVAVPGG